MQRMEYYDFWRHYRVKAWKFKEARITFSRALEDRTEDQYYVETTYGFPGTVNQHALAKKTLRLANWFFEGILEQLFGWYPKQGNRYGSE
jgi:hypothetical protein